ncbi:MAG: adenylosuccinate synthetase, partial [Clostridiales bacterium]|nr:adenylosuccinate synthetase [Clostridiales bacterium]
SGCRTFEELPKEAQDYILFAEKALGCRVSFVSVGAERDQLIVR